MVAVTILCGITEFVKKTNELNLFALSCHNLGMLEDIMITLLIIYSDTIS
jgi:hypothetical protein